MVNRAREPESQRRLNSTSPQTRAVSNGTLKPCVKKTSRSFSPGGASADARGGRANASWATAPTALVHHHAPANKAA